MNEQEILHRLQPIFQDVLQQPDLSIQLETDADSLEGWDSLAHISLLESIQQEFGCHFGLEERLNLLSVRAIVQAIQAK